RRCRARVFAAEGDHHSDATADRGNSGDGEPAELRSQSAQHRQARANEESGRHRHDGAGFDVQDSDGGGGLERKKGAARHYHLLQKVNLELWREIPLLVSLPYVTMDLER